VGRTVIGVPEPFRDHVSGQQGSWPLVTETVECGVNPLPTVFCVRSRSAFRFATIAFKLIRLSLEKHSSSVHSPTVKENLIYQFDIYETARKEQRLQEVRS